MESISTRDFVGELTWIWVISIGLYADVEGVCGHFFGRLADCGQEEECGQHCQLGQP